MTRLHDAAGNVIQTHEHGGDFKGVMKVLGDCIHGEFVNRPFQVHKRSQLFIGARTTMAGHAE